MPVTYWKPEQETSTPYSFHHGDGCENHRDVEFEFAASKPGRKWRLCCGIEQKMENSIDLLLLLLTRDPEIMDGEENKIRPHRNCRELMQDGGWIQLILQANILGVVYSYYLGPIFYSLQKL